MEDRSRIRRLHPGCLDRPHRDVPSHTFVEDGDEGAGEVIAICR